MRHYLVCKIANRKLSRMTDDDIIMRCPEHYGTHLTYDHLNLVWDKLYDQYNGYIFLYLLITYLIGERA